MSVLDLVLSPREAVSFEMLPVAADTLEAVLSALRPFSFLSSWKLITVQERAHRHEVLESMQAGFRRLGKEPWARTMERWKAAPVLLVFMMPDSLPEFGGVPAEAVRPQAHVELGMGIEGLVVVARTYGLETHWIASAPLVQNELAEVLGIPERHHVAFFGLLGFPAEEIEHEYPAVRDVWFSEAWGRTRQMEMTP